MIRFLNLLFVSLLTLSALCLGSNAQAADPIKVLVITGGCCHDYDYQTKAMQLGQDDFMFWRRGVSL